MRVGCRSAVSLDGEPLRASNDLDGSEFSKFNFAISNYLKRLFDNLLFGQAFQSGTV